uniref:Secreted protein n=1 Tax=Chromera velia CCMP2878 TaxID=1169474 RepID=A0A0G4FWI0_9ALVE|mmetsp:Transcript_18698/g.37823  ORF Transcript_18698/g.37823 Transcript_18698/m.37823 type:complete len:156 (-) Transcript_18698:549-1016(-)|eukprot:Cvel_19132.t1-p1 / transcript=Cvel_19132.t1 / gene=Cvel_19132 / organism=Chromera_velia_CCMP2878 / gene_product=hypothetical protein / transcript_product=hypothetical protein / location=Cvel_scaffold1626:25990-27141(+) / protein_length=155 / sequence_SO=supercontig / SO=protein_coding / is_pseudo=false
MRFATAIVALTGLACVSARQEHRVSRHITAGPAFLEAAPEGPALTFATDSVTGGTKKKITDSQNSACQDCFKQERGESEKRAYAVCQKPNNGGAYKASEWDQYKSDMEFVCGHNPSSAFGDKKQKVVYHSCGGKWSAEWAVRVGTDYKCVDKCCT